MDLSIIILNYKTKDLVLKCIESIVQNFEKELNEQIFEIILVDNASGDKSVESFKKSELSKYFKLIESKENLGFGGGNNLAAKNSSGVLLLFLNSDTEIEDKGLIKMVRFIKNNKEIGILGGKMYFPSGKIQTSAGKFYNLFNLFLMLFGAERFGLLRESPQRTKKVDWVSGASLMIKKKIFDEINGFDEKLFMYMEDVEICYRVKKMNFLTYFFVDIKILHKERGSSNKTFAILNIYKGVLFFYKKHKPYWQYVFAKTLLRLKAQLAILLGFLTFNRNIVSIYKSVLEAINL